MTECEKLRNDLKAFLDGQLSPATRIAMRLHLNRCASCRKELEEMRLLGTNMRATDTLEMSDALRSRILASVPTTAPEAKVKMLPKWREKPVLIWGASASAALAWFILYPAINNYQDHASRSATATSNARQIGLASQLYTQDYDEGHGVVRYAMPRTFDVADSVTVGGATNKKSSPYFPTGNGLVPLVSNGNGNPVGGANRYQVYHSRTAIGGQGQASNGRADQRYVDPSQNLLQNGVVTDGHVPYNNGTIAQLNLKIPRESTLSGKIADSAGIKTDPANSGQSQPNNAAAMLNKGYIGGSRGQANASSHKIFYKDGSDEGFLNDLPTERQVHKEASLTVEVANAEQQSESVERLVKESKGYVAQNQLTTVEDGTRQASLTCKVPVDQFDTVMGQVARLGLLKGKTLSGEDITEKVSDEQETGHVLRADIVTTEEKLKTRKRHSETVRDEETLRQLRIRVAQSQARLKMLTRLGALSEITVELAEKPKNAVPEQTKPASPFMEEVSGTGQAAAHSFLMALRLPVQLLVWIVVYSPLWALLIFGYRRMTR
jgi:hypothetical protein